MRGIRRFAFAVVALLFCLGCGDQGAPQGSTLSYSLGIDLEGRPISTDKYAERIVVVAFWATWCPPCREQIAVLDLLQARYFDDIRVVGVSVGESLEVVVRYLEAHSSHLQMSRDPDFAAMDAMTGSGAIPTTVFIDDHGQIRCEEVGVVDLRTLSEHVGALMTSP
jgi:thiol-disulfide isomerase/thioredoxin